MATNPKPFVIGDTLIEADNYHALQLLEYLYAEKVDCIYIDPPYNTGAKDWKYNNDYLFPFSALERMLPKNGKYEKWEDCIDRLLGDRGWREEFYKKDPQMTLFDLLADESGQKNGERMVKNANPDHIKAYIISRLETIFPCVSKHARIFRNSRNSPMFLFCFAISNENPKAQGLALRMADHILKNK